MTVSWNSLVASGSTTQKRFVLTVIRKSDMVAGTMDAILKVASWSFNILLSGEHPERNYHGMPAPFTRGSKLADGWCGSLCQIRGDWQFYCEVFLFPQWNCNDAMCWLCRASSVDPRILWTDHRCCAGWRSTLWTHETYMQYLRDEGRPQPTLLAEVTGLRLEQIMIDILHTVDQGVSAHIIGNILWIVAVVRSFFGVGNMREKVKKLNQHIQDWYKRTKCPYQLQGPVTLERLRATSAAYPKLKGKAAAIRYLMPYALELAMAASDGSDTDRTMVEIARLMVRFYNIVSSQSQFLTPAAKEELPAIGQEVADYYSKLASEAFDAGKKLWKESPKLHLWEHLTQFQCINFGNPRYYWTYPDEDLVGAMIEIAETCHPNTLPVTVLFKWLHFFF